MRACPKDIFWRSKRYMDYISCQPSDLSGQMGYDSGTGEYRNDPHHYRKGSKGGTGIKPSEVWVISLTHKEHVQVEAGKIVLDDKLVMRAIINHLNNYLAFHEVK